MKYQSCPKCSTTISNSNIRKHISSCDGFYSKFIRKGGWKEEDGRFICLWCSRDFKSMRSTTNHIWRAHTEKGRNHIPTFGLKFKIWNKGLTSETDERVKKYTRSMTKTIRRKIEDGTFVFPKISEEGRKRISIHQSLFNNGGRCKWYDVAGQKVQGTWERDIALKFEEMGIHWKKVTSSEHSFVYELGGKIRRYTPDFYLKEYGVYLEVKGYWWGNDREKMNTVFKKYPSSKIILVEKLEYDRIMLGELVW